MWLPSISPTHCGKPHLLLNLFTTSFRELPTGNDMYFFSNTLIIAVMHNTYTVPEQMSILCRCSKEPQRNSQPYFNRNALSHNSICILETWPQLITKIIKCILVHLEICMKSCWSKVSRTAKFYQYCDLHKQNLHNTIYSNEHIYYDYYKLSYSVRYRLP